MPENNSKFKNEEFDAISDKKLSDRYKPDKSIKENRKIKEPLVLRIILWSLVAIFLIGSPIAITVFFMDTKESQEALQLEIQIERNLTDFASQIIQEQEYLDNEEYQKAYDIALEANKKLSQIERLFEEYFTKFDESVSGFLKVKQLFDDLIRNKEIFYEINKVSPLELEKSKNISE